MNRKLAGNLSPAYRELRDSRKQSEAINPEKAWPGAILIARLHLLKGSWPP